MVFVGLSAIDAVIIFRCVFVKDGVALIVITATDKPAKDMGRILWIGDP